MRRIPQPQRLLRFAFVGAGVPDGPRSRQWVFAASQCETATFYRRDVREAVPYNS